MPKPTELDAQDLQTIATAEVFVAFLQVRPGERLHEERPTQAEARAIAQQMANHHRRTAMVYAVSPQGRSVLVETVREQR